MTATDELRKLLDERGVEWKSGNFIKPNAETQWGNNRYADYPELLPFLTISNCTPEQAIAATLGRGACRSTTPDDAWCFACSECGKSFPRDELHLAHNHGEINYCPNCGRKVVER